jgi:hypothetical protein
MATGTIEATTRRVAAAERRAAEARHNAELLARAIRQLVAIGFERVTSVRHQSEEDIKQARAALAEARQLLARAEKLTQ